MNAGIDFRRTSRALGALVLAILSCGCATARRKPLDKPIFYPPPPGLPRIQYLTSFTGSKDIEEQSSFNRFVVGELADVKMDKPYGVAIHDGKMYVCDTNSTVVVFDLKEKKFGGIKGAEGEGALRQPINVTIDAKGTKYIADTGRAQIVVFDAGDAYVRAYGAPESWRPVDAAPFQDRLYVVDGGNWHVKVFDLASGEIVRTIGDKGDPSERLDRPTNIAIDQEGNLYVTDMGRFQVLKFDRDGRLQKAFGDLGDSPGFFARPKGIALDRAGRLFAVDAAFNNVQVFDKSGRMLMFFGGGGDRVGSFLLPAKVAIDYDNVKYFEPFAAPGFQVEYLILVTSQFGGQRLSVLAFGKDTAKQYPSDDELTREIEERRQREIEKLEKAKKSEEPGGTDAPKPPGE